MTNLPQTRRVADFVQMQRNAGTDEATIQDMVSVWQSVGLTEVRLGTFTLLLPPPPKEKEEA